MPCIAVNTNRIRPIANDEPQTCCGANGAGLWFENAHIENAGDDWMPINANM